MLCHLNTLSCNTNINENHDIHMVHQRYLCQQVYCLRLAWLAQGKQTARPRILLVFGIEQSPGFGLPAFGMENVAKAQLLKFGIWLQETVNLQRCSPSIRLKHAVHSSYSAGNPANECRNL